MFSCIRLSTTFIPTGYNDTLVWNNQTHQLVGYTVSNKKMVVKIPLFPFKALLPTRLPYSHRFHNLSASFALLDKFLPSDKTMPAGWYTTEWTGERACDADDFSCPFHFAVISQWFDLQLGIISDCKQVRIKHEIHQGYILSFSHLLFLLPLSSFSPP